MTHTIAVMVGEGPCVYRAPQQNGVLVFHPPLVRKRSNQFIRGVHCGKGTQVSTRAAVAEASLGIGQYRALVSRHCDGVEVNTHTQARAAEAPVDPTVSQVGHVQRRSRWLVVVLGNDHRTQIRVTQWSIAALTYVGSSLLMIYDHYLGWLSCHQLVAWLGFLTATQALFYVTVRSGLSAQCKDPALTVAQILVGVLLADWAFLVAGPGRAVALMPMLLVMIFGAFLLHWKKIAVLTLVALTSFGVALAMLEWLRWNHPGTATRTDFYQDLLYFASLAILLPMVGVLAAQLSRLRSTLRTQRGALVAALADVQRLAEFDELTGLANRRRASDYLAVQRDQAQRSGSGLSVALIDLDNFKGINDTRGHDAGDRTLRAFADLARPLMRATDLMARWGGEEFLIVMPDTSTDEAYTAALRLLKRVHTLSAEQGGPLSFSAGIAHWQPGEPVVDTVARADHRMYNAKHAGRNQVHMTG